MNSSRFLSIVLTSLIWVLPRATVAAPPSDAVRTRLLQQSHVRAFAAEWQELKGISDRDNRRYVRRTIKDAPRKKWLFYVTENTVLKHLNDNIVDKDVATALTNVYKQMLHRAIRSSAVLRPQLLGSYSDWKTLSFAFAQTDPRVREAVAAVHDEVARRYQDYLLSARCPIQAELKQLLAGRRGRAADPSRWHLGGVGENVDQATLAAREARTRVDAGTGPRILCFEEVRDAVRSKLVRADHAQRQLEEVLGRRSPLLTSARCQGRKVVSQGAIDILRKGAGQGDEDLPGQLQALRTRFKDRFGLVLSDRQLLLLREHFNLVDSFSVSLFKESKEGINVARAPVGRLKFSGDDGLFRLKDALVSVDFSGQGVRNHFELQLALVRYGKQGLDKAIRGARAAERQATRGMDNLKRQFNAAVTKAFPAQRLTREGKVALMQRIGKLATPSRFRVSFLPPGGEQTEVPETLEKRLRLAQEQRVSWNELEKTAIAVDLTGRPGTVSLLVGGRAAPGTISSMARSLGELAPEGLKPTAVEPIRGKPITAMTR